MSYVCPWHLFFQIFTCCKCTLSSCDTFYIDWDYLNRINFRISNTTGETVHHHNWKSAVIFWSLISQLTKPLPSQISISWQPAFLYYCNTSLFSLLVLMSCSTLRPWMSCFQTTERKKTDFRFHQAMLLSQICDYSNLVWETVENHCLQL